VASGSFSLAAAFPQEKRVTLLRRHLTGVIHTAEGKRSIDDDLVICIDRHAEKRQRDDDRSSPVRFSGRRRHGGSF
jgi:hypothetical protein